MKNAYRFFFFALLLLMTAASCKTLDCGCPMTEAETPVAKNEKAPC